MYKGYLVCKVVDNVVLQPVSSPIQMDDTLVPLFKDFVKSAGLLLYELPDPKKDDKK